jgi:indole-3-glycerol phosphate synthase/phosphoribosylanthranilate isomerase
MRFAAARPAERSWPLWRQAVAEGFLAEVASMKREELQRRFDGVSLDSLRDRAMRTSRKLERRVADKGARFILEIKKASPSAGAIRGDADAGELASGYAGVADALSVLCDSRYFKGSLADLAAARREFDGPILAKDFFIDIRQVAEARIAGADAVLVMLSLLDDRIALAMVTEARRLGMDAVVEVHSEAEMRRALALNVPLIGINNRDLRDLSVDLRTTEQLAKLGSGRTLIAASGISTEADVERLGPLVDGFLVGSSLMGSSDPPQAARRLVYGRTKLCGLNSSADLSAARPAAFAGFVFVAGSPRNITVDEAEPLCGIARRSGILPIGVFRNSPLNTIVDVAILLDLHAVQLHGSEDHEYVKELRSALPGSCEIWTAVSVGKESFASRCGDRILLDNGHGGTGRTFDWSKVQDHPELRKAIVAGGIGPHNAAAARQLGAYAIDVGSSVDVVPGRKSSAKIGALFDALRRPSREAIVPCA